MAAYFFVLRDRTIDPSMEAPYQIKARQAAEKHDLKVLAYRGLQKVVEGPPMEAACILEFPTYEDALRWYESPEYQDALQHRLNGGKYRAVILDGVG